MAALFDRMTDGFAKLKWVAAGTGVLFWLFVCKLCGASLVDLLRFSLSVLFYLLFPGLFFVRRNRSIIARTGKEKSPENGARGLRLL